MAATSKKSYKRRSAKGATSGFGQAVLASLRGWERGEPVTVRQVPAVPLPRPRDARAVKRFRTETLGVSQAVFARLLGVSPKLVEAWESGRNVPAGPVCRLCRTHRARPARIPSSLCQRRGVSRLAHRFSTTLSADTIVVMEAGEIVGQGKHDDLLRTCATYKQLYERQLFAA